MLSARACAGLKSYQYKAGGYTWLDRAHEPVWTYMVNLLPLWLAPNLITLIGTCFVVAAYALNMIYDPGFNGTAPPAVYWFTAASIIVYVNMDCMDGKQARRTGSSSPLGQLFDHGCDALALHMMLGNISASLGVSCGWKMAAGCLGIMVPWMLAQLEEYHTSWMTYGNGAYGVLEANYSICIVHVLTAVLGRSFWQAPVPLPSPLSSLMHTCSSQEVAQLPGCVGSWAAEVAKGSRLVGDAPQQVVSVADVALVAVSLAGLLQGASNVSRILAAPALPAKEAGCKQLGRAWAAWHLVCLMACMGAGAWSVAAAGATPSPPPTATSSLPTWVTSDACQCRFAFSTFGVMYALTATMLIIAHMSKEAFQPPLIALALPALLATSRVEKWQQDSQVGLLLGVHAFCWAVYVWYVTGVISQICTYLGIKCLSISPVKKE